MVPGGVFHSVCPERGGHDCPHRTDDQVQSKRHIVCVSPVSTFGMKSDFADSCSNTASPDCLLIRKFADVAYAY